LDRNYSHCSYPTYEEWKHKENERIKSSWNKSSYPTYEEWKHFYFLPFFHSIFRSYPTYEEWKLEKVKELKEIEQRGSYPTYEEWKQVGPLKDDSSKNFRSYPTYEEWKLALCHLSPTFLSKFLSYL